MQLHVIPQRGHAAYGGDNMSTTPGFTKVKLSMQEFRYEVNCYIIDMSNQDVDVILGRCDKFLIRLTHSMGSVQVLS